MDFPEHNDHTTTKEPKVCGKACGGYKGLACGLSIVCRLAIVPLVWWGLFGFWGRSGVHVLQDVLDLTSARAAAIMAVFLAVVSTFSVLPCCIHKCATVKGRGGINPAN
jgi:hypothetical protein